MVKSHSKDRSMDMNSMAETTKGDAAPQATGADADAEEMPLLFMDGLPSGFQQSAQLAALATFMADSDGDQDDDENGDDSEVERGAGKRPASARRKLARRKMRTPYARPQVKDSTVDKASNKEKKKKEKEGDATKELQLYLSMFKV